MNDGQVLYRLARWREAVVAVMVVVVVVVVRVMIVLGAGDDE